MCGRQGVQEQVTMGKKWGERKLKTHRKGEGPIKGGVPTTNTH